MNLTTSDVALLERDCDRVITSLRLHMFRGCKIPVLVMDDMAILPRWGRVEGGIRIEAPIPLGALSTLRILTEDSMDVVISYRNVISDAGGNPGARCTDDGRIETASFKIDSGGLGARLVPATFSLRSGISSPCWMQ